MPVTRSNARSSRMESVSISTVPEGPKKRRSSETKTSEGGLPTLPKVKRIRPSKTMTEHQPKDKDVPSATRIPILVEPDAPLIPAQLSFSFEDAKTHLIGADNRFKELFANVKCKPFENLEPLDPFRTLVMSILGQQISWLAARSIAHKFLRLFNPSLPVSPPDATEEQIKFFPTPRDVADASIESLRTAGLSQRKAEYVKDISARFADGRLSAAKLAMWNEEEVAENLIAVRGIGPWTVHMFSIFSLRQPDVLGVGDLGLQKGLLRWVISSHNGNETKTGISINPKKLSKQPETAAVVDAKSSTSNLTAADLVAEESTLRPVPEPLKDSGSQQAENALRTHSPTLRKSSQNANDVIRSAHRPIELPQGLTLPTLKARLNGSKVKGQYLTPDEMYFLTRSWRPYRSLGCYYLWALSEGE